eukprot:scaffold159670_cov32-Tisochrysis_lutea.AAC.4
MENFQPGDDPQGCLARALDWRFFQKDGKWYARETNTMPQWAGSCWYYLRFADPANDKEAWSAEAEKAWLPVDLYVGGAEHAVLHLLYARFWHKVSVLMWRTLNGLNESDSKWPLCPHHAVQAILRPKKRKAMYSVKRLAFARPRLHQGALPKAGPSRNDPR